MSANQKKVEKEELARYLEEVKSWETNRVLSAEKSKRIAWRIATCACGLAAIAVIGLSVMGPLKKVEPFVIRVDNTTGIVDVVTVLKDQKSNYEEAINKFFVQSYVRYREGYSYALAPEYYRNVGLMSSPGEQQRYFNQFNPKNPMSPLNLYQNHAQVKITIKSTSFIKPDVALVRYVKEIERGQEKTVSHWAATVSFTYTTVAASEADREINPLGFRVEEYRNDPEGTAYEAPAVAPVQEPAADSPGVKIFPDDAQEATQ